MVRFRGSVCRAPRTVSYSTSTISVWRSLDAGPRRAQIDGVSDIWTFRKNPPWAKPSAVLVDTPEPAAPIPGAVGSEDRLAFYERADQALQAAGFGDADCGFCDAGEIAIDPDGTVSIECSELTAAELRTIADVMDALAKETR